MKQSYAQGNLVLSSLAEADFKLLEAHLAPERFCLRHCLEAANRPIPYVYFPYRGIISVVAETKNRRHEAEVGLIGWEGMTGLSIVLGADMSPLKTIVQVEGDGQRIGADRLRQAMEQSPRLRNTLLHHVHVFAMQAASTALVNACGTLNQRLARWLLMAHDRIPGDELPLTHEFLAVVLGVRRAGVTMSLNILQARGFISLRRGKICVVNRDGLVESSDGLYDTTEQDHHRLLCT